MRRGAMVLAGLLIPAVAQAQPAGLADMLRGLLHDMPGAAASGAGNGNGNGNVGSFNGNGNSGNFNGNGNSGSFHGNGCTGDGQGNGEVGDGRGTPCAPRLSPDRRRPPASP